ncbi:HIT family protein [Methanosarcinales archaeon]|nr:MAG: HIT family protein [Methanosarcinales archaeon]
MVWRGYTMESECIFCRIVDGEIPAVRVYEDGEHLAFLDTNPRSEGHVLAIPKEHIKTNDELGDEQTAKLFIVVKRIAESLKQKMGVKGYNIVSNNGEIAGQVIPHVHIHIVPRYEDQRSSAGFESAFPVDAKAKRKVEESIEK